MASILDKIQSYVLPKEVDFFNNLIEQSKFIQAVIDTFHNKYFGGDAQKTDLTTYFSQAEDIRQKNLIELNNVLITPIDKEAIGRAYLELDWVILSIKHLDVEINAYQISSLKEYTAMFELIRQQAEKITYCFDQLKIKNFEQVLTQSKEIIDLDDALIVEYSYHLSTLFSGELSMHVIKHKAILNQTKELSKRMRTCANLIEDFVFKMN